MVLRLCEALDVPLRERNALLHAAGLPAAYPQRDLAGPDLAPYRRAIERMLTAHQPFPAMVVDAYWTVVAANDAAAALYGEHLVGTSIVDRYLTDPAAAQAIVNWPEVAWAGLDRLRHHAARAPADERLCALVVRAEQALVGVPRPEATTDQLMVCPWYRVDGQVIRTIGMVARFDPVAEVTLDDVRIELTYPLDDVAERFFRQAADRGRR